METNSFLSLQLSPWQRRQAAMLYRYSSLDYLRRLHQLVSHLIDGVADPLITLAQAQGRDAVVSDAKWGGRYTSENWANNAWPILKELQAELSKDIALRSFDKYKKTSVDECLRGAEQFSMLWSTPEEERQYQLAVQAVNNIATRIDNTVDPQSSPRWSDYSLATIFPSFIEESPKIPEFRVREDLKCRTGSMPPRTGVYVSADDANAALQFAATGPAGFKLREAKTFNHIGLEALAAVGRADLWTNAPKMLEFALTSAHSPLFSPSIRFFGKDHPNLAASAVAR